MSFKYASIFCMILAFTSTKINAQGPKLYQSDFDPGEFKSRHEIIYDAIGKNGIALIQGAPSVTRSEIFRQSNNFYYLSGIAIPHAYILLDGSKRSSSIFIPHRDESRERSEGKMLSFEDADIIKRISGFDQVLPTEKLGPGLAGRLWRGIPITLFTPFNVQDGLMASRDGILNGLGRALSDPFDITSSREGRLINLLRSNFPQYEIKDISKIIDEMRFIKSPTEIAFIRKASQISGYALIEAMRSTRPGIMEYELEAVSKYIQRINGAEHEGYHAIVGSGKNAWNGHYIKNSSPLISGDLVLMDHAADYRYYTSDIARMWPVNGKFTTGQKELYGFIVKIHKELQSRIRPGISPRQILDDASKAMQKIFEESTFSKPTYKEAAFIAITDRNTFFSHCVGLTVHDPGHYMDKPLKPGMVFSIDPMLWVPSEKLYIRVEDVVVVTDTGVENFTEFMPLDPGEIEKTMKEKGVLEFSPKF